MAHNTQHVETHHEGDAHVLPVEVTDENGDPMDITGATIEWYLKQDRTVADADAALSKDTSGGGVQIINATAGEAEIQIDTGDTDGLVDSNVERQGFDHVCRITIDGDRLTVFTGSFQIEVW